MKKIINKYFLKLLKVSLIFFMIISVFNASISNVKAEVCSMTEWEYAITIKNPAYSLPEYNGGQTFTGAFIYKGIPAYCIEPLTLVKIDGDVYETGTIEDYLRLNNETKKKITEYSYFGYGYNGRNAYEYYAATQILIHAAIDPVFKNYEEVYSWNKTESGMAINVVDKTQVVREYINEIEEDVRNYENSLQEANFVIKDSEGNNIGNQGNDISADIKVGETISITDTNNTISSKHLIKNTFSNATIEGNTIKITGEVNDINKTNSIVFGANLDIEDLGFRPVVLASNDYQDVIVKGTIVKPQDSSININVTGTKLRIRKNDLEGNTVKDAKLVLAKDSNNNNRIDKNEIIKKWSSSEAEIIEEIVGKGRYIVSEEEAPKGYVKSNDVVFDITDDSKEEMTIEIKNFQIKALKIDDKGNPLSGIKLQVVDRADKVIDSWITTDTAHIINGLLEDEEYHLQEVEAREEWEIAKDITFQATSSQSSNVIVMKNNHKTNMQIKKSDNDLNTLYQGDATLVGAEFSLSSNNKLIGKMTVDKNGMTNILKNIIKDETYTIEETKIPEGYRKSETRTIDGNKLIENRNNDYLYIEDITNTIIRGGFKVIKNDKDFLDNYGQGDAADLTTEFTLINKSKYPVYVDGKTIGVNEKIAVLKTDNNGIYETTNNYLPYGTYLLKETKAPTGYTSQGQNEVVFSIRNDGEIVDLTKQIKNEINRMNLVIQKRDYESKGNQALGGASLKGAKFEVYNASKHDIYYHDKLIKRNELIDTLISNENGQACISDLPYGTYRVKEIAAPIGYLAKGILERTYILHEEYGVTIKKDDEDNSILNDVIRGDFSLRKIDSETQEVMSFIPFKITSNTTGESHSFMTDENGYYSSENKWISHDHNTNGGSVDDGLWFGEYKDKEGNIQNTKVNNDKGALPFDTYTIEELPCEKNKSKELFKGTLTIKRDNVVVNLYNIENKDEDIESITPVIKTNASDENGYKLVSSIGKALIKDEVSISNADMLINQKVLLEGSLIDKETKQVIAIQEKILKVTNKEFIEILEFEVNGNELKGKDVVVFENLYLLNDDNDISTEELIASHADIDDINQTVHFPKLETTLTENGTDNHEIYNDKKVVLEDKVKYQNLEKGKGYVIEGILMDKESGNVLLGDNGEVIKSKIEFVAKEANGEVIVPFKFNLQNKTGAIVAFETLIYEEKEYAIHADIDDENQTVNLIKPTIPKKVTPPRKTIPNTDDHSHNWLYSIGLITSLMIAIMSISLRLMYKFR